MNNKEINSKLLGSFSDILNVISSLISIIPFLLGYFTGCLFYYIIGIILVIIILLLFIFRKQVARFIFKFFMRLTCPDKSYKLKEKEVTFEYISRSEMQHKKTFKVTVLHDGFTGITDKYRWTAPQELTPTALHNNQEIKKLDKKIGMQRYEIKFRDGQRYNKHDEVPEMGMEITNMIDENGKSSPHLSSGVFEITDMLVLHVIFNIELMPRNIRKLEYLHYSDDDHYSCEKVECTLNNQTNKKEVIWKIKNPIYGGKYMIDWSFEE